MSKVLCFSYERLFYPDNRLSGPGSRLWDIATTLKNNHNVTIAELDHDKDYSKKGIKIIGWDMQSLKNIEKEYDVAFIPISAYIDKYFDKIKKIPTIVDLSTPIAIEAMAHSIGNKNEFLVNDGLIPTLTALEKGDMFICSNKAQKYFYLGMLTMLGIKNFDSNLIQIAPISPNKIIKKKSNKILEKVVGKNKKILLFMGGLYAWYDYVTPIKAMNELDNKDIVLVFVGALNPNIPQLTKTNVDKAKALAKKLELLDKTVFFTDWVSSDKRYNVHAEADIAIVTSKDTSESTLSYRMRIVDFLQTALPVICTDNDELSNIISTKKLGETVKQDDYKTLSKLILKVLENKSKYKDNIIKYVKDKFNNIITLKPVDNFCVNPKKISKDSKVNFLKIIDEKNKRIKTLEYIRDDKVTTAKELSVTLNKVNNEKEEILKDYKEQLFNLRKEFDLDVEKLNSERQQIIQDHTNHKETLKNEINKLNSVIEEQSKIIDKQKSLLGKFQSSITFPFYKLTNKIGKTGPGKILQKLIK